MACRNGLSQTKIKKKKKKTKEPKKAKAEAEADVEAEALQPGPRRGSRIVSLALRMIGLWAR